MPSRGARKMLDSSLSWTEQERARRQQPGEATAPAKQKAGGGGGPDERHEEVPAALQLALRRLAASGQLGTELNPGKVPGQPLSEAKEEEDDDEEGAQDGEGDSDGGGRIEFEALMGFLTGGEELHAAFMTLEQARSWCTQHTRCHGFYAARPNDPAAVLYLTLVGKGYEVVQHQGWYAWARRIAYPPIEGTEKGSAVKEEL